MQVCKNTPKSLNILIYIIARLFARIAVFAWIIPAKKVGESPGLRLGSWGKTINELLGVRDGLNLPQRILNHPRLGLLQRPDRPVPSRFPPRSPRGSD